MVQGRTLTVISQWVVARRYSLFEELDKELKETLPKDAIKTLPELPEKGLFRKFDDESVEAKRTTLQIYLSDLIAHGPVRVH